MAIFIPTKPVTAPLDERVRARLRGEFSYASSGSDHDGAASASADPSLLNYFLDSSNSSPPSHHPLDSDSEPDSPSPLNPSKSAAIAAHLRRLLSPPPSADPLRPRLLSEVQSAAAIAADARSVMTRLRLRGFNAGVCKARWDSSRGLTAGSHEYIDIVVEDVRYIVEIGFAAEFDAARATDDYAVIAAALPAALVALPDEVREAVTVMAEAARRSFKGRGMSVPPWRKRRYMVAKWLGGYRRTVNGLLLEREGGPGMGVTCRFVGFGEN